MNKKALLLLTAILLSSGIFADTDDTTPPELESVSFNPLALDVTAGPDTITFTIGYSEIIRVTNGKCYCIRPCCNI